MDFPPKTPSAFAPGMTMPVVAGQEYTLKDTNGDSLVLEGRDDPLTIEFINAYDEWVTLLRAGFAGQHVAEAAGARCDAAFNALPRRIKDGLPSRKTGIVLPGIRL